MLRSGEIITCLTPSPPTHPPNGHLYIWRIGVSRQVSTLKKMFSYTRHVAWSLSCLRTDNNVNCNLGCIWRLWNSLIWRTSDGLGPKIGFNVPQQGNKYRTIRNENGPFILIWTLAIVWWTTTLNPNAARAQQLCKLSARQWTTDIDRRFCRELVLNWLTFSEMCPPLIWALFSWNVTKCPSKSAIERRRITHIF